VCAICCHQIEQPTFVAMYAELCEALAQQLPELAPPKGETKPMSFQRLLLNHCQDQFEGTLERRKVHTSPLWMECAVCC
jgi:translation initiation factor 4G